MNVIKNKKGQFIVIESVHQEEIILNICILNNRAPEYIRQKLIKLQGEIDKFIVTI